MEVFRQVEQLGSLYPYFDYAQGYGLPQALRLFEPPKVVPTFDFVPTATAIEVVVRPMAQWRPVQELPLYADSVLMRQPPAGPGRDLPRVGREPVSTARASGEPALPTPLAPPGTLFCYWHVADARGRLRRYQVIEVTQRAVLRLAVSSLEPGDVLRVHIGGYTAELRLP
jgi:hypothetical protein